MNHATTQNRSPFKFLDAYDRNDRAIFFGREKEIESLFDLVRMSKLVLVYGLSGTGKTSLVNFGLANKFSENKWFPLFVRRGDHLPDAIHRELNRHAAEPFDRKLPLPDAMQALYQEHFVPIYLIFDQFEELFISGSAAEQREFFDSLAGLFQSKVACRIIIMLREEYLAWFSDFEKTLPVLFDNRFRVERMRQKSLEEVVMKTLTYPSFGIELTEPERTVADILENLRDERKEIDLTNLQVYLDHLWQRAKQSQNGSPTLCFDPQLVAEVGKLEKVISQFLDEQMKEVAALLPGNPEKTPLEVLSAFVTNQGTKQNLALPDLQAQLKRDKNIAPATSERCVQEFINRRILRVVRVGDAATTTYELAHDMLAGRIFRIFTTEEQHRRKAREVYAFYTEVGRQRLFTQEELETLAPYLLALPPDSELENRMAASRAAIRQENEAERERLEQEA
ncbi:MAG: ATP-binding protein, partial [Bacteroidota bacterium]